MLLFYLFNEWMVINIGWAFAILFWLFIIFWSMWTVVCFFLNQANICQVMPKKPFSTHIVYTPNLHTRLQSLLCETKFSKENFSKVLVIKCWMKWGVVCENLTGSSQVMPQKSFWAHLPQIYILGPSPHVILNFQKKKWRSVDHKILNKMRGYLWKSGNWLPSYAQK